MRTHIQWDKFLKLKMHEYEYTSSFLAFNEQIEVDVGELCDHVKTLFINKRVPLIECYVKDILERSAFPIRTSIRVVHSTKGSCGHLHPGPTHMGEHVTCS